ncbi:MAG TPA: hemerythrin domain-containing protein [Dactylosporangium sp.]|jgi:hypothetical protein|nr:hemerythrin domain-containing protein [Dactylosporangium sp.]
MRDEYDLDMTMMLTIHGAFRRELERIERIAAGGGDDPGRVLRAALGWRMFARYLHIHHTTEDETVWGIMPAHLAGRPDELALLEAMEAEHAAIDPLLTAVEAAVADRERGHEHLGGAVGALAASLRGHLEHEEAEGLALVDATLSGEEWSRFAAVHMQRVGAEIDVYFPWLLDGQSAEWTERVLSRLPAFGRANYEGAWRAAYERLDLWAPAVTS